MSKEISSLWVGLTGNISGLAGSFSAAVKPITSVTSALGGASGAIGGFFGKALKFTGIGAAIGGAFAAMKGAASGVTLAADLEQVGVAFETMLGSAEKSKSLMNDLTAFSASTPFEFPEIANSAKKLLAFGVGADQMTSKLTMLGDISAGIGAPLEDIAAIYGKIKSRGQLTGETLNQMAERGIPIYRALAESLGVAESQIAGMVTAGKIGFADVDKALSGLTKSGGQFSGMMAKQSQTLAGLWSTLTDNIGLGMAKLFTTIVDTFSLRDALKGFTNGVGSVGDMLNSAIARWAPAVKRFGLTVWGVFTRIYDTVTPIAERTYSVVANLFGQLAPTIGAAGAAVWSATASAFSAVYDYTARVFTAAYEVIRSNWQSIVATSVSLGSSVVSVVQGAWTFISELASSLWSGIVGVWNWGSELITGKTGGVSTDLKGFFQAAVDVGNWFKETFATIFTAAGFALTHWKDILAVTMLGAAYEVVRLGNQIEYVFTEVIPAYLNWFAENWSNILTDVFNFTGTVFTNLSDNVVDILQNLPGLISGSVSFSDIWTPLTDGFESSLSALPTISARQVGDLEQSLLEGRDSLNAALNKGLGEALVGNKRDGQQAAKAIGDAFASAVKPPPADDAHDPFAIIRRKRPILPTPEIPQIPPQTVEVKPKLGTALRAGSAEAQALRFAGPVPVSANASQSGTAIASKQLTESQKQTKALQQIATNTGLRDDEEVEI